MGNNLYAITTSARSFRTTSTYNLRWPKGRHLSFLQQKINMLGPKFFPCYSLPTFPLTSSLSCSSHCLQEPSIHLHTKLPPSPSQFLPPHFPLVEILLPFYKSVFCRPLWSPNTQSFLHPFWWSHRTLFMHLYSNSGTGFEILMCLWPLTVHWLLWDKAVLYSSLSCPWLAWHGRSRCSIKF